MPHSPDFHTPRSNDSEMETMLCTCCKNEFPLDEEGGGNPYLEMCVDCIKLLDEDDPLPTTRISQPQCSKGSKSDSSQGTFEQDQEWSHRSENSETPLKGLDIIETQPGEEKMRAYYQEKSAVLTKISDDSFHLVIESSGEEFFFDNEEYLRDFIDDMEFVYCFFVGCTSVPIIQCLC